MNPSNHVIDFLPDFLMGSFEESERDSIQLHLKSCGSCRREYESLSMLWNSLGAIPDETPGPAMHERFHAMLAAYQEGIQHGSSKSALLQQVNGWIEMFWPKQPAFQLGIGILLFAVGAIVGTRLDNSSPVSPKGESTTEMAQLRGEVQAMSRMLAMSLMQQQSPSERLRGVSMSYDFQEPDQQLTSALFKTLNYDQNVNVRLAAVDALANYGEDALVRQGVIKSLSRQSSPILQVALVDLLVRFQEKGSRSVMSEMLKDRSLNATVKTRMEQALKQLL